MGARGWSLVAVALLLLYPLSASPLGWVATKMGASRVQINSAANVIYHPVQWLVFLSPKPVAEGLFWYHCLFFPEDWSAVYPDDARSS